jgi:hypothetical protein
MRPCKLNRVALPHATCHTHCNQDGATMAPWMELMPNFLGAAEALVLGSSTYPRPCSGYSTELEKKLCFCHYHPGTGTYVWPFSTGNRKCRDAIQCTYALDPILQKDCTGVVDDLEFNGQAQCVDEPSGFECSTGGTFSAWMWPPI